MIRPPGMGGVAFTEAEDGDQRLDERSRAVVSATLGLSGEWASARQVHGNVVHRVDRPGETRDGDGLWSTVPGLPLVVFTADCFGIVLHASDAVGVAHAGWRGAKAGLVTRLRHEMVEAGHAPTRAAVGPGIGPCCFEVGEEVASDFDEHRSVTSWGTGSVDLASSIVSELGDLEVWRAGACTLHQPGWFSYRRDQTSARLATIGWLP